MIDVDSHLLKRLVKAYIVGTFKEELILSLSFSYTHQLFLLY
jgi:hypothetical protein